jgi:alanyl-tRNA synthetase
VFADRPVTVAFEDAADAAGLRKASAREGTLRVVTIDGVDRSACGGTHVRATGEIGPVLIRRVDRVRKAVRVEFLCGMRAVRRARADYDALSQIAQSFSTSLDEAPSLVRAQTEQARAAAAERERLERELGAYRARELYDTALPDERGVRWVVQRRPAGSLDALRVLAHAVAALPHGAFLGVVDDPPSLILATAEDTGLDAGPTLKRVLADAGGRGGGSSRVAQGSVPDVQTLERVVALVRR